jgi:DNA-binding NarL/FixJ family response regulator
LQVPVDVFLVEDQQYMGQVLMELLGSVGEFRIVGTARTEAEALSWLDHHPGAWQLCIIDLVLDQGSGISVIVRARLRGGNSARIAVLSSFVSPGMRKHCLKLGADGAFQKDSGIQDFLAFCAEAGDAGRAPSA